MLDLNNQAFTLNRTFLPHNTTLEDAVIWNGVVLYAQKTPIGGNVNYYSAVIPPVGRLALSFSMSLYSQKMTTRMTNGTTNTEVLKGKNKLKWTVSSHNGLAQAQAVDNTAKYVFDERSLSGLTYYFIVGGFNIKALVRPGALIAEYYPSDPSVFSVMHGIDGLAAMAVAVLGTTLNTFDPDTAVDEIVNRISNITASMTNR